jgi:cbb3-type cytochrome oxidase maturation protein
MVALTFFQFLIALCMGLGAVCIFTWAAMAGQFDDIEAVKHQVLEVEKDD